MSSIPLSSYLFFLFYFFHPFFLFIFLPLYFLSFLSFFSRALFSTDYPTARARHRPPPPHSPRLAPAAGHLLPAARAPLRSATSSPWPVPARGRRHTPAAGHRLPAGRTPTAATGHLIHGPAGRRSCDRRQPPSPRGPCLYGHPDGPHPGTGLAKGMEEPRGAGFFLLPLHLRAPPCGKSGASVAIWEGFT